MHRELNEMCIDCLSKTMKDEYQNNQASIGEQDNIKMDLKQTQSQSMDQ